MHYRARCLLKALDISLVLVARDAVGFAHKMQLRITEEDQRSWCTALVCVKGSD